MIFPSNRVRIMVATKPIDFRKGHDSLAAMVKNELRKDPFTGTVFVFRAKKADRLKLTGCHPPEFRHFRDQHGRRDGANPGMDSRSLAFDADVASCPMTPLIRCSRSPT